MRRIIRGDEELIVDDGFSAVRTRVTGDPGGSRGLIEKEQN
jgi:hypothetical protein